MSTFLPLIQTMLYVVNAISVLNITKWKIQWTISWTTDTTGRHDWPPETNIHNCIVLSNPWAHVRVLQERQRRSRVSGHNARCCAPGRSSLHTVEVNDVDQYKSPAIDFASRYCVSRGNSANILPTTSGIPICNDLFVTIPLLKKVLCKGICQGHRHATYYGLPISDTNFNWYGRTPFWYGF